MSRTIDQQVEQAGRRLAGHYSRRGLLARAAAGAAALSAARMWNGLLPAWASTSPIDPELTAKREALFRDYVDRQKRLSPPAIPASSTVCDAWSALPAAAKGTFLTLTHRLHIAQIRNGGYEPLLRHMTALYSIRGDPDGDCGGKDDNRLFLGMDQTAHHALIEAADKKAKNDDPRIRDFGPFGSAQTAGERRWRKSGDTGTPSDPGAHAPFDTSTESNMGRRKIRGGGPGVPRAQTHFYCDRDHPDARERKRCRKEPPIVMPGTTRGADLASVDDVRLLEIDHDYDLAHHSSTECNTENAISGRADYERNYYTNAPAGVPAVDYDWKPKCDSGGGGGGGGDDCHGLPCGPGFQCPGICGCFGHGTNRVCGTI